jgi:hypothetical protein
VLLFYTGKDGYMYEFATDKKVTAKKQEAFVCVSLSEEDMKF